MIGDDALCLAGAQHLKMFAQRRSALTAAGDDTPMAQTQPSDTTQGVLLNGAFRLCT